MRELAAELTPRRGKGLRRIWKAPKSRDYLMPSEREIEPLANAGALR